MSAMRRTERLFAIIQILRRARAPITAASIADELETSLRTVYRDIAELIAQRVPVRGEAGIGYMLESGFDMPPLMLTPDEIEAAVLGARWVAGRGDPALARAANDLVAKIGAVIPSHLRPFLLDAALTTPERAGRLTARQLRRRPGARRDPRPDQDRASPIATRPSERRGARSGRSPSPTTRPCGCWPPGASCARTSATSAPTGCSRPTSSTSAIRPGATSCAASGASRWRPSATAGLPPCRPPRQGARRPTTRRRDAAGDLRGPTQSRGGALDLRADAFERDQPPPSMLRQAFAPAEGVSPPAPATRPRSAPGCPARPRSSASSRRRGRPPRCRSSCETDEATLAPRLSAWALASSRVIRSSAPVKTTVLPATAVSVFGPLGVLDVDLGRPGSATMRRLWSSAK